MSEEIIVLSEKDKARKRINVFHGSANNYINMIKELIGNSLDIFSKDKLNTIQIILHNPNKIEYIDSGYGIPVEKIASDGSPNYQAIFEKDFAGSRYNNESATIGQNGIFLYTLSMTSREIEYFIARPNGNLYNITYQKGDRIGDLKIIGQENKTYSKMIFSLDEEVWNNPHFTFEEVCSIAQAQASLSNVKITVADKENNLTKEFCYPNGIEDYFNEMIKNKSIVSDNIQIQKSLDYTFSKKTNMVYNGLEKHRSGGKDEIIETEYTDNINFDLIFSYSNDSEDDFQKEFLNTADLLLHGTIQEGIYNGLKNSIDKWLEKYNKYDKKEKHITLDDISTGLNYICNMSSLYVEYDNQIKQKTSVKRYKAIAKDIIEEYMEVFFIENPLMSEKICMQVLINARVRNKADKARQDIKKKLQGETGRLKKIEGLKDCDKDAPFELKEIWFSEGISPSQTMDEARDEYIMALFPLRGRFINALKGSMKQVLNNKPALGMINALGCGVEIPKEERKLYNNINLFNKDNLRYNKIIIATDADSFGHGITLSLIAFFYRYMKPLLMNGHIYISISPRYEITYKDELYFAYNETEKNKMVQDFRNNGKNVNIGIVKGLGQLSKDTFWNYVMNPENRILKQITYQDAEDLIKYYFNILIGDDIEGRKKYVKENITNVNYEEID